ncbi:hypothetical protein BUALT_Bualt03G0075500 [Buddleja alternifolia]|uniref:AT hook motif-containing protein n=1 Tax=Buddleja alternifolia TaxID=168488 RepID=A0AAV6XZ87_9LAMI|nr:hypothetical protein BUALT_Bualt03G0075500 [Buddleja alternifolia]
MANVSVSLPAKRKRGRPRKNGNLSSLKRSPENPSPIKKHVDKNSKDGSVDSMVGRMIYGVIEGSFDAGFLVSVRIGSNATPYRGVIFEPEKFVPITSANDVAAQAKMYQRRELPIPVYDYQTQSNGISSPQALFRPVLPSMPLSPTSFVFNHANSMGAKRSNNNTEVSRDMMSESSFKASNDKLKGSNVELHFNFIEEIQQNEMLCSEMEQNLSIKQAQIHSVPREAQAIKNELQQTNIYYNEQPKSPNLNFNHDLFANQSQRDSQQPVNFNPGHFVDSVSNSRNLKLDRNELKSRNLGFHQAFASANPLLLSPKLISQPLEFMLEKPKSPPNYGTTQETNFELESRDVGSSERFNGATGVGEPINYNVSAPYKLELGTAQSASSTRTGNQTAASSTGCISDMDFVLSNVTGAHGHESDLAETKHR